MSRHRIIILVENTVYHKKMIAEEGLSVLIQELSPNKKNILFDLGRRWSTLEHNLKALDISLDSIDTVVLTHGHAGHIGALAETLPHMKFPRVVLHPRIFARKAKKTLNTLTPVGSLVDRDSLIRYANIIETDQPFPLTESVWTSGQIPILDNAELGTSDEDRHWVWNGEEFKRDSIMEENAMFIRSDLGVIIVTSCGHRGASNIVALAQSMFPNQPVAAVIGGFHLMQRPETTPLIINRLKEQGVQRVMPCHCTGFIGKREIAAVWEDGFYPVSTGACVEVSNTIHVST